MAKYVSKTVEQFKVGDRICLYGWDGVVSDVYHCMVPADKDGNCTYNLKEIATKVPCTYLTVNFDEPSKVGYQYEGGEYGGKDGVVTYAAPID